jgi:hypothetical protein
VIIKSGAGEAAAAGWLCSASAPPRSQTRPWPDGLDRQHAAGPGIGGQPLADGRRA